MPCAICGHRGNSAHGCTADKRSFSPEFDALVKEVLTYPDWMLAGEFEEDFRKARSVKDDSAASSAPGGGA